MIRHTVVVCDVGPSLGSGHAMRCLALAEELLARGGRVTYLADVASVPWVDARVRARGIAVVAPGAPEGLVGQVDALEPDAVVVDSYHQPTAVYRALRGPRPTLAFVDQHLRGAEADLLLDANIGSEHDEPALPAGTRRLAGLDYALMRADVIRNRPTAPRVHHAEAVPRVLGVFGGTDPAMAGPDVAAALVATGLRFEATVVAPTQAHADAVATHVPGPGQRLVTVSPTDRLPELAVESDVVLSASGTSTWELLCLGAATGLVCTADNQALGYRRAAASGVGLGLGEVHGDLAVQAVGPLRQLLSDPTLRTALSAAAWRAVDGRGAARVVDAVVALASERDG